jgi:hypothetical protein
MGAIEASAVSRFFLWKRAEGGLFHRLQATADDGCKMHVIYID